MLCPHRTSIVTFIAFACVIIMLLIISKPIEEFFPTVKIDTPFVSIDLYNAYSYFDLSLMWKGITNIDVHTESTYNKQNATLLVQDAFEIEHHHSYVVTVLPFANKYAGVVKVNKTDTISWSDINDISSNAVVGLWWDHSAKEDYNTTKDLFMIAAQANNVDITLLKIHKGNDISKNNINQYDVIFIYGTIKCYKDLLARVEADTLSFLDMERSTNIHIVKLYREYLRYDVLDTHVIFEQTKEKLPYKRFLIVPCFIICQKPIPTAFPKQQVYKLMENAGQEAIEINNYYTQFFTYQQHALSYIRQQNNKLSDRLVQSNMTLSAEKRIPILEQFLETSKVYYMISDIHGYLDTRSGLFMVSPKNAAEFDGIDTGYIVVLKSQERLLENGMYTMLQRDPNIILKRNDVNAVSASVKMQSPFDLRYTCYGDPYTSNKALCNSPLDETGQIKKKQTYWDRPCEKDADCPFFQANKNYMNYRGGCVDGYCELPIGVRRQSWRLYDPTTKPLCHGCPTSNMQCCDQQYPPDYAFELDFYDRKHIQQ